MVYSIPTILPTLVVCASVIVFLYLGWAALTHH